MWDVVPSVSVLVLLTSQENVYRMLLALHYDWVLMQFVLILIIAETNKTNLKLLDTASISCWENKVTPLQQELKFGIRHLAASGQGRKECD